MGHLHRLLPQVVDALAVTVPPGFDSRDGSNPNTHTMLEILFTTQAVAATAVLAAFFACAIKFAEIAIKEAKKS